MYIRVGAGLCALTGAERNDSQVQILSSIQGQTSVSKPPEQEPSHGNAGKQPSRWDYAKLLSGVVVVAGCLTLLAVRHPTDYGVIPSCPFYSGTGFYCPGCGSLRATHYLVTGHPLTGLRYNPLVLLVLPLLVFSTIRWFCQAFMTRDIPFPRQTGVYWAVLIVFLVFFIARNIPLELFDVLRPPAG